MKSFGIIGTVLGSDDGDMVRVQDHSGNDTFWARETPISITTSDERNTGVEAYLNVKQAKKLRKLLKKAIAQVENP